MDDIIISQSSAVIDANFTELKAMLQQEMDFYSGMIFTEESEKAARETLAKLRKQQKEIGARVKEEKDKYMVPWNEFSTKVNEIVDMFNKPIVMIQSQCDEFEEKRKSEKMEEIKSIYKEFVEEEYEEYIPLSRIFSDKWLNKTFSLRDIKDAIMTQRLNVRASIESIKNAHSEIESKALEVFKVNLNMSEALNVILSYENQKKEVLERERERVRAAEEERIRREERQRIELERKHAEDVETAKEDATKEIINTLIPTEDAEEPEEIYVYNIFLTSKAKDALEIYMNTAGITYTHRKM